MSYPLHPAPQYQPLAPQPKSKALKTVIVIRNLCIALVAAVFLLFPAQAILVTLFAPELIDPEMKTDPVSETGKYIMLFGSGPAFAALGIAQLVEHLMKKSSGGVIALVVILYSIACVVAIFAALMLLLMLDLSIVSMRGGSETY